MAAVSAAASGACARARRPGRECSKINIARSPLLKFCRASKINSHRHAVIHGAQKSSAPVPITSKCPLQRRERLVVIGGLCEIGVKRAVEISGVFWESDNSARGDAGERAILDQHAIILG